MGMKVDELPLIVARFHRPAADVDRLGASDVFQLRRSGDFAVSAAIEDDAFFVSWGRQTDDWQACVCTVGVSRLRWLAAFRRTDLDAEERLDSSGEALGGEAAA